MFSVMRSSRIDPKACIHTEVFNDGQSGQEAKKLVMHGDITHLSIYANQLKQNANKVIHGQIREVSLVLSGANPWSIYRHCNCNTMVSKMVTAELFT